MIGVANAGDSLDGDQPWLGQPIRKRIRQVIQIDQIADDASRTRIGFVVCRVKAGKKGLIGHEIPPMDCWLRMADSLIKARVGAIGKGMSRCWTESNYGHQHFLATLIR